MKWRQLQELEHDVKQPIIKIIIIQNVVTVILTIMIIIKVLVMIKVIKTMIEGIFYLFKLF